ncbi:MAG TPA: transglutaminase-like domain-containing protein [Chloroflexota bacterium]
MDDPKSCQDRLAALLDRPDDQIDLAVAALLIAEGEYPGLDQERYLKMLDALAAIAAERLGAVRAPRAVVDALNVVLFQECGFRGNALDYYDPRNSFLNDVLERRLGIPITLSLLYMEVARRLGVLVEGVGLPGHFVVRVPDGLDGLIVDPFFGGALLSVEDCVRRVDAIYKGALPFRPEFLAAVSKRQLLARMLGNLKAIYLRSQDLRRALRTMEALMLVAPSPEERRDRGLTRLRLGDLSGARDDLDRYLEARPAAPDAERVRYHRDLAALLLLRRN